MTENGKISSFQMGIMMYPTMTATGILLVPAVTAAFAGRDMWLSPVWASLTGFFTVYIAWSLNRFYPNETIIEYVTHIVGFLPGKVLGLFFLFFYWHVTGIVIREYGEFIAGNFLPRTPLFIVMGSMILVCAFNARGGLEVIGRSAQIFVPIVILLFTCIVLLLIPDMDPKHMLPLMEHGIVPSLKGSLVPQGWFSEYLLMTFMLPYLSDRDKGLRWGLLSVLAVMLTLFVTNTASLFVFGDITSTLAYPVMSAARYISIAEFFEHLESIFMAIWVAGTFIKISLFHYVLVLGTAQWSGLCVYRHLTLPIGLSLLMVSLWVAPSLQELVHFISTASPFYFVFIQIIIPLILLMIARIKESSVVGKKGGID